MNFNFSLKNMSIETNIDTFEQTGVTRLQKKDFEKKMANARIKSMKDSSEAVVGKFSPSLKPIITEYDQF